MPGEALLGGAAGAQQLDGGEGAGGAARNPQAQCRRLGVIAAVERDGEEDALGLGVVSVGRASVVAPVAGVAREDRRVGMLRPPASPG